MITVSDLARQIESIAPLSLQEDYDNSGLQVGDPAQRVTKVLICIDVTEATVAEASELGAQMIISHHPLLFRPCKKITPADYIGRTVMAAIRAGITLYAAHTNLDNAKDGVNYKMAEVLGLHDLRPLAPLPAGRTRILPPDVAQGCGSGLIGTLSTPMSEEDFIAAVKAGFLCPCVKHNTTGRCICKVALCGGAGGSLISVAQAQEADAFVTGEVGYHPFFGHPDLLIVEAGHFETEQYTCQILEKIICHHFPDLVCVRTARPANPIVVS